MRQIPGPRALSNSLLPLPFPAGDALLDAGESMKRLAEVKDSLDIEVKQNFIDPLQNLCDKDLKEIQVNTPMVFSHLLWLFGNGAACSGVLGTRGWQEFPALCVFSPSRLSGISSLLSAAPAAPEQPQRLHAAWNGSPFAVCDGGCHGDTSQHPFWAC